MRHRNIIFITFSAILLLSGCNIGQSTMKIQDKKVPAVSVIEKKTLSEQQLVYINNNFAFNLYRKLNQKDGNIFFSPFSISSALSMTFLGAQKKTQKEMSEVLGLPVDSEFAPAFYTVGQQFKALNDKGEIELSVSNALWAQQSYKFLDSYLDINKKFYDSSVFSADFKNAYTKEKERINEWVSKQTREKIKDLIPEGVLNELTRMVLTNAIYFKGIWKIQFDKKSTRKESFFVTEKKEIKIPMMNLTNTFNYFENEEIQMLEMPYKGDEMSILMFLPVKNNNLKVLEDKLTYDDLKNMYEKLKKQKVRVFIPQFKLDDNVMLKDVLTNMGMIDAFTMEADFSKMDGTKDLYIANVVHKAFVDVNEEGSEAAAATAVVMATKSLSLNTPPIPIFRADQPFLFMIIHRKTESILFIGRLSRP